jgi:eukaryotic-like serine/threonine-protein kinase
VPDESSQVVSPREGGAAVTEKDQSASGAAAATSVPPVKQSVPPARSVAPSGEEGFPKLESPSFAPGMLIAEKYVIERVLGEGGIGVVVAAKHVELDQLVAIKYLRPKVMSSPTAADRFLREARLAAKIHSEHVVHVYDVGRLPDGSPYMVMEYLAGTDLGKLLAASGPLPLEWAIDYVLQTCEALAEAHVAGIVHRDLKPDNLFVATGAAGKSVVKILDFGISKLSAKRATPDRLDVLTQANDKFGTPVYMSPEQLRSSGDVDARADVWAVGVVLYELLTGRLPFDGDSLPELCTAILTLPPASLKLDRPYLPAELQLVIERCLEKDREARFQNVAELAQELSAFAAPVSHGRVDHVLRVIREAGEQVRAPTPMPGEATARAIHEAATLEAADVRSQLTTARGVSSWSKGLHDGKVPRWTTPRVLKLGAFIAAAAALLVALVSGQRRAPAPNLPAGTSVAREPTSAESLPVATAAPAADGTADSVPAQEPEPTVSALSIPPKAKAAAAKRISPKPSASAPVEKPAPASSAFESTAVINPFE